MNPDTNHDWLDEMLRSEPKYIDDDGFTAQVEAALPQSRNRRRWLRPAVLGGMTLAGCGLGLVVLPGGRFIIDCVTQVVTAKSLSPSLILPALVVAALIGLALSPVFTER